MPSQDATPSFYTAKPGDEFVDLDINDLLGEFSAEDQAEIVTITSTMIAEDRLYAQRLADLRRAVHLGAEQRAEQAACRTARLGHY